MGRALTWADPVIFDLASNNFIPVAADDWYQRRRDDDEGAFFRKVADQGPRIGTGGSTRQGIYVFSAGGVLLGYKNQQDPKVMRQFLLESLKAWQRLPAPQRVPKAVQVEEETKVDRRYHREPPPGGAIVNVYTRILDKTPDDSFCHGSCKFPGGDKTAHDHLWIFPEELTALLPASAKAGDRSNLPPRLVNRIARFHLVDNTRGEPPFWNRSQVRDAALSAQVEKVDETKVYVKLTGKFLLATNAIDKKADRGYDVHLLAYVEGDSKAKTITRFDAVAIGDHWGAGPFTGGARPGRTPLGVAFSVGNPNRAADRVPPQAARDWGEYQRAEQ